MVVVCLECTVGSSRFGGFGFGGCMVCCDLDGLVVGLQVLIVLCASWLGLFVIVVLRVCCGFWRGCVVIVRLYWYCCGLCLIAFGLFAGVCWLGRLLFWFYGLNVLVSWY